MDILKTIRKEIKTCGKTRYRISKDTGITEGQLHRILVKNQSIYCSTADILLDYFGYKLTKDEGDQK
ncbi:MAG: hypothetical protein GXY41_04915 [Phycisphaerae bacterium]|nr:hypothetical protein [Phycisphaerae bacterium]